jgi:molybdenum cofactor guanylyltransferase
LGGGLRIFGVILAGGAARRMGGRDKALLPLAGRSLLAHAVDRLEPQVERLAISANGDAARFGPGFVVLPDDSSQGPLSGILAALDWARALGATAVVSVAVDTPFVPADLVPRLCLAAEGSDGGVAIAASGGADHPTFGLWPVGLRDALQAFLASGVKTRVMDFANAHGVARAVFGDDRAFRNLNTPEDLAAAEALIGGLT